MPSINTPGNVVLAGDGHGENGIEQAMDEAASSRVLVRQQRRGVYSAATLEHRFGLMTLDTSCRPSFSRAVAHAPIKLEWHKDIYEYPWRWRLNS